MNNNYYRWLYGDCGCCQNNYQKIEDCDCDNIMLQLSNIHTDINVLQQEIDNIDINLEDYYTKDQIDVLIPTNVSELVNDAGYITNAALVDYATKQWVINQGYLTDHTPLKTINGQVISGSGNIVIASGGTVDVDSTLDPTSTNPVENKTIVEALNEKLDASAYTPTDLSNYYNKQEVNNLIPTSNSAFTNDMHYLTSADTANYITSAATQTMINNAFYCCSEAEWQQISGSPQNNVLYLIY